MPYGKIHEAFFGSSIMETKLPARYVFMSMIVLSDQNGRLDITRQALARRIKLPIDAVHHAIEALSAPDPGSRSPEYEGRRILPIDKDRSWGWIVVNKAAYRHTSDDLRREQAAERKRRQRERERAKQTSSSSSSSSSSDTDTDTDTESHARHAESREVRDNWSALFTERWERYPRKEGRKKALNHFLASVQTADDLRRFDTALTNYLMKIRAEQITDRYVKCGSTFFDNWEEYVDWKPAGNPRPKIRPAKLDAE